MAWVTPPTAVAGTVLTAATWNQVRDDLIALLPLNQVAWTSYTPTFTQSATITKTITYAKYTQIGKMIVVQFSLSATSSGTINNAVTVGAPVTAAASGLVVGSGYIFDASAAANYPAILRLASTTTFQFTDATQPVGISLGQTGAAFAAAIVSTDAAIGFATYEAA